MRRLVLALACAFALLAGAPSADAQAIQTPAADAHREMAGPIRIATPISSGAALRVVADSALAAGFGGGAEFYRLDADIYELSRYVGIGFAAGAVVGLLVGAVAVGKDGMTSAPLLILYTAGGATVGMVTARSSATPAEAAPRRANGVPAEPRWGR